MTTITSKEDNIKELIEELKTLTKSINDLIITNEVLEHTLDDLLEIIKKDIADV